MEAASPVAVALSLESESRAAESEASADEMAEEADACALCHHNHRRASVRQCYVTKHTYPVVQSCACPMRKTVLLDKYKREKEE